jgi:protein-L-isoaspartate(D-aspartate) O-methyltransferase
MDRQQELAIVRRVFAKQVLAADGIREAQLESAFSTVERERYLGPGPWPIVRHSGYLATPDANPVYLYCDVLIGIFSRARSQQRHAVLSRAIACQRRHSCG